MPLMNAQAANIHH